MHVSRWNTRYKCKKHWILFSRFEHIA